MICPLDQQLCMNGVQCSEVCELHKQQEIQTRATIHQWNTLRGKKKAT